MEKGTLMEPTVAGQLRKLVHQTHRFIDGQGPPPPASKSGKAFNAFGARTEGCFLLHHASAAVRRFDEREKPPNGGQTQQAEIQITRE